MPDIKKKGANNEPMLQAVKDDNEETLLEIFEEGDFDINYQDGLGNTALHYAVLKGSTDVLPHILEQDGCDVDPVNRLEKKTPLHYAMDVDEPRMRAYIVDTLLDAGADARIRDKYGETAESLASRKNLPDILKMIKRANARRIAEEMAARNQDNDDEGDPPSDSD